MTTQNNLKQRIEEYGQALDGKGPFSDGKVTFERSEKLREGTEVLIRLLEMLDSGEIVILPTKATKEMNIAIYDAVDTHENEGHNLQEIVLNTLFEAAPQDEILAKVFGDE